MKTTSLFNVVILMVLVCSTSYADELKASSETSCTQNLYNQYMDYRRAVLSANLDESKVLGSLVVSSEKIDDVNGYLKSLRLQEAGTKSIQQYFYSCSADSGDLYLKLKNFDQELSRAHVRFETVNGSLLIKYVSLERMSMEKYIDSEGDFIVVE